MTEDEWLNCNDPNPMVEFMQGKASDRKLRLFAVACCRRRWDYPLEGMDAPGSTWIAAIRNAVNIGEKMAEGQATAAEIERARRLDGCGVHVLYAFIGCVEADENLREVPSHLLDAAGELSGNPATSSTDRQSEAKGQCGLFRCVFGNPFTRIRRQRKWLTTTVIALARGIYEEKAFDRLPILADALQDAGYENAEVLDHCRRPGEHVRGCWVVDLLTGRK